jgi:hypothetical protein
MGVVDKCWYRVTCKRCSIVEITTATDAGPFGSNWSHPSSMRYFSIQVSESKKETPRITRAICNACDNAAVLTLNLASIVQ